MNITQFLCGIFFRWQHVQTHPCLEGDSFFKVSHGFNFSFLSYVLFSIIVESEILLKIELIFLIVFICSYYENYQMNVCNIYKNKQINFFIMNIYHLFYNKQYINI